MIPRRATTAWPISDVLGEKTVVLLWIFADWCPVCHKEFHELIRREDRFRAMDVAVATLECHDRYRGRVMVGQELRPAYWFADKLPGATRSTRIPTVSGGRI